MFQPGTHSALLLAYALRPPLEWPNGRAARAARRGRSRPSLVGRIRAAVSTASVSVDPAPTVSPVLRDYPYPSR